MRSLLLFSIAFLSPLPASAAEPRPNILWLSSEDHGPHMGCYGDTYASTPNMDRLAAKGMIYLHPWSNAPVCAPARTTIITGLYAPSTGAEHMRSMVAYPHGMKMFPQFLREAGYYCTNNVKEDYNIAKPAKVWDESSRRAHWRNRRSDQPFFAVFNSVKSHESQIRIRPHKQIHDPAKVRIPAYHPDTPEVRQDWAQYYDQVSEADAEAGKVLKELEADGLADETIVFYFADHGSGMPRSKRWPYDSGLHVPMIVYIPEKLKALASPEYKPGGKSERLVSFVDLAPTVLSLAGIQPPTWLQGHAFLGRFQESPQTYLYGFRGRMDERFDMVRSVTDGRYVYVRNYMPHKIYGQHLDYMFQTPTTRVWKKLHDEGKLTPAQDAFWKTKPPEELYDLHDDADEIKNLADSSAHREVIGKLRRAHRDHVMKIRDVGFLPEGEMHARSAGSSPYDMGHDDSKYPLVRIFGVADMASSLKSEALSSLRRLLADSDSCVRWWAALGILMRGKDGVMAARDELRKSLGDASPYVRIAAAEGLAGFGDGEDVHRSLNVLGDLAADRNNVFVAVAALNAIGALGDRGAPLKDRVGKLSANVKVPDPRYAPYVPRLLEDLRAGKR